MQRVGRNAPCPCNSGLKYKRCCEARNVVPFRPAAFSQRERDRASGLVCQAAIDKASPLAMNAEFAQVEFFGEDFEDYDERDQARVLEHVMCTIGFTNWAAYDLPAFENMTVAELLLNLPAAKLTHGERVYLDRMSRSRMGLYEVVEVRLDEGLSLVDLWTKQRIEVTERSATRDLVRYDVLGTRLMEGPKGTTEIDGAVYPFSPPEAAALLKEVRLEWKRFAKAMPDAREDEFLKLCLPPIINQYWIRNVLLRPLPSLATSDGEPQELCRAVFDVTNYDAVRASLRADERFSEDEDDYVWVDLGSGTVLGTGTLTKRRLTFETMNRKRADAIRELLATLCAGTTRYRVTEYTSIEQALAQWADAAPNRKQEREVPSEIEREIIAEFEERYYREWLDIPLPALRGRTPRHAATLKTLRPALVDLLKDFESHAERRKRSGKPAYDFSWMWRELGLEPALT